MRKLKLLQLSLVALLLSGLMSGLEAFVPIQGYSAPTPHDPTIWDGRATSWEEWAWAARFPNWFNDGVYPNAGFFYYEHKYGWQATSSRENTMLYPGVVFFIAHDIEGEPAPSIFEMFRQRDDNDWNVAEMTYEDVNIKCWIFGGQDATVDTGWIKLTDGLASSHLIPEVGGNNLINDAEGSFIVRIFDDPSTDVHWFPGDPEPGDANWNWADWYGAFGSYGFNNSFYTTGLDTRTGYEGANEVYEWAFYWGHPGDSVTPQPDTVVLPGGVPAPPFIDSTQKHIVIIDPPKDTIVFWAPNWRIHQRKPLPLPEHDLDVIPSQDTLAALGDEIEVYLYTRNMGIATTDTYNGTVTDTKGWGLDPENFETTLASEAWEIRSVTVTVPGEAFLQADEISDTVIMTLACVADPTVVKACSLVVAVTVPGAEEPGAMAPATFNLSEIQANPVTSTATISYQLPAGYDTRLIIYDPSGRVVRILVDEKKDAGYHTAYWDGCDNSGRKVNAGVYICRLEAGAYTATRKVILFK